MTRATAPAFEQLVCRAWCEALGLADAGPLTWEESGGDSLATLHLLVLLEKALCRKLSFDLIDPDLTVVELAALLASPAPAVAGNDAAPTVYLFPGMLGDEPRLSAFRRSFAGRIRFEVVDHPEVTAPRALLTDIAATARLAARAILARQPEGPLHLAGYSYGGGVAFEAARHLQTAGRQIAFLGILDTALDAEAQPFLELPRRMALRLAGSTDVGRRTLFRALPALGTRWSMAARVRLLSQDRHASVARWRPAPLRAPALLVVSEQFGDVITERWMRLCPGIQVLRVPARHHTLFEPEALAVLTPQFEAALHRGRVAPGSPLR